MPGGLDLDDDGFDAPWFCRPGQRTPPQGRRLQRWQQDLDSLRPSPTWSARHPHGGGGGGEELAACLHYLAKSHLIRSVTNPSPRRSTVSWSITFGFRRESIRVWENRSLLSNPSKSKSERIHQAVASSIPGSAGVYRLIWKERKFAQISRKEKKLFKFHGKWFSEHWPAKLNPWNWREKREIGRNMQIAIWGRGIWSWSLSLSHPPHEHHLKKGFRFSSVASCIFQDTWKETWILTFPALHCVALVMTSSLSQSCLATLTPSFFAL